MMQEPRRGSILNCWIKLLEYKSATQQKMIVAMRLGT